MQSLEYILSGAALGLVAGISPGPILALVISESIKYGRREGMKVAFVPLVSDLPIVLFTLLILSKIAEYDTILGVISILGAGFLCLLAYESLRTKALRHDMNPDRFNGFWKGVLANFLSPHPYLFWLLVGSPMVIRAYGENPWSAAGYVGGFYFCMVTAKLCVAWLSDKTRNVLGSRGYVWVNRILGLILLVIAAFLVLDGLQFLGNIRPGN
jgi:threonine/homoserine/homoserine lactone efflux protein